MSNQIKTERDFRQALQKKWGKDFTKNFDAARNAFQKIADSLDESTLAALEKAFPDPVETAEILSYIGSGGPSAPAPTPAESPVPRRAEHERSSTEGGVSMNYFEEPLTQERLEKARLDKRFYGAAYEKDSEFVQRVNDAYDRLFPGTYGIADDMEPVDIHTVPINWLSDDGSKE